MTPEAFDALAQLLRLRAGPAREAARMVLVDGLRTTDAAALAGCSQVSVSKTVAVCKAGQALVRRAAGI